MATLDALKGAQAPFPLTSRYSNATDNVNAPPLLS